VVLLDVHEVQNRIQHQARTLGEDRCITGDAPISVAQGDGVAQRVKLKLALPYPWAGGRPICGVPVPAWLTIEGIGIRVVQDAFRLAPDQPAQQGLDVGVPAGQREIRGDLGRGIAQPHRRDVAGHDECRSVGVHCDRGLERVRVTVFEQSGQLGPVSQSALDFVDHLVDGRVSWHRTGIPSRSGPLIRAFARRR
jgi:hypothetical protein